MGISLALTAVSVGYRRRLLKAGREETARALKLEMRKGETLKGQQEDSKERNGRQTPIADIARRDVQLNVSSRSSSFRMPKEAEAV